MNLQLLAQALAGGGKGYIDWRQQQQRNAQVAQEQALRDKTLQMQIDQNKQTNQWHQDEVQAQKLRDATASRAQAANESNLQADNARSAVAAIPPGTDVYGMPDIMGMLTQQAKAGTPLGGLFKPQAPQTIVTPGSNMTLPGQSVDLAGKLVTASVVPASTMDLQGPKLTKIATPEQEKSIHELAKAKLHDTTLQEFVKATSDPTFKGLTPKWRAKLMAADVKPTEYEPNLPTPSTHFATNEKNQVMAIVPGDAPGTFKSVPTGTTERTPPVPAAVQNAAAVEKAWTPDAIEAEATQRRITGKASTYLRDPALQGRIKAEEVRQNKALNQTVASSLQKQAVREGSKKAMDKAINTLTYIEGAEGRALPQADLVIKLSDNLPRTFSPIVNKPYQVFQNWVAGDKDTQLAMNAILTFTTEYSKIMEGSTSTGGAPTVAAQHKAEELVKLSQNPEALRATVEQMKWEMATTKNGWQGVYDDLSGQMLGATAPGGVIPAPVTVPRKGWGTPIPAGRGGGPG